MVSSSFSVVCCVLVIASLCGQRLFGVLYKPDLGDGLGPGGVRAGGHPGQRGEVPGQVGLVVVARLRGDVGEGATRRLLREQRRGVLEAEESRVGLGGETELAPEYLGDVSPTPSRLVQ